MKKNDIILKYNKLLSDIEEFFESKCISDEGDSFIVNIPMLSFFGKENPPKWNKIRYNATDGEIYFYNTLSDYSNIIDLDVEDYIVSLRNMDIEELIYIIKEIEEDEAI